tara:strand:- start:1771 stop:2196 length:426 start_codon:yes stop_codon:yes gene_type:complete
MKLIKYFLILLFCFLITNLNAKENFFQDAKSKYDEKELEESKFLFQRNIVFNPKDAKSYLYLAKIYKSEENKKEESKYLKTTLLLDPENEEALYMLIEIELEKSNYSKIKELSKKFNMVCSNLCVKSQSIEERLKNIEANE